MLTLAMEFSVTDHIASYTSNPKTELNCKSELKAQLSKSQSLF